VALRVKKALMGLVPVGGSFLVDLLIFVHKTRRVKEKGYPAEFKNNY